MEFPPVDPPPPAPLNYADLYVPRRPRRYAVFAALSCVASVLMLLVGGSSEFASIETLKQIDHDAIQYREQAEQQVASIRRVAQMPPPRGLTPSEVAAVLARITAQTSNPRQRHPGPMTEAQVATLKRMLSAPGQLVIEPSIPFGRHPIGSQYVGAGLEPDGTLSLGTSYFRGGPTVGFSGHGVYRVKIAADGKIEGTPYVESPAEQLSEAKAALANSPKGPSGPDLAEYDDAIVATVAAAFQIALAIFLFFAAMLLFRRGESAVRLHQVYAGIQILVSCLLGGSLMWMIYDSPAGMVFYLGAVPGAIGCIYPLVIFAGLRVPSPQVQSA